MLIFYPKTLKKVISGGQTGIDQLGLEVARSLGIPTGGWAPRLFRTETGPNSGLISYGLKEHASGRYEPRTEQNVLDADGTVILGDITSTGSKQTIGFCVKHKKPYKINPSSDEFVDWIGGAAIHTLNVAGNRGSKLTQRKLDEYRQWLTDVFSLCYNRMKSANEYLNDANTSTCSWDINEHLRVLQCAVNVAVEAQLKLCAQHIGSGGSIDDCRYAKPTQICS